MNAVILACTTLIEYVEKAQERCGTAYPIVELDRKYHDEPADMRRYWQPWASAADPGRTLRAQRHWSFPERRTALLWR